MGHARQDRATHEALARAALDHRFDHPHRWDRVGPAAHRLHPLPVWARGSRGLPHRERSGAQIHGHPPRVRGGGCTPRKEGPGLRCTRAHGSRTRELLHRRSALLAVALADLRKHRQAHPLQRSHARELRKIRRVRPPPDRSRGSAVRRLIASRTLAPASQTSPRREVSRGHRNRWHGRLQGNHVFDVRRQVSAAGHRQLHVRRPGTGRVLHPQYSRHPRQPPPVDQGGVRLAGTAAPHRPGSHRNVGGSASAATSVYKALPS